MASGHGSVIACCNLLVKGCSLSAPPPPPGAQRRTLPSQEDGRLLRQLFLWLTLASPHSSQMPLRPCASIRSWILVELQMLSSTGTELKTRPNLWRAIRLAPRGVHGRSLGFKRRLLSWLYTNLLMLSLKLLPGSDEPFIGLKAQHSAMRTESRKMGMAFCTHPAMRRGWHLLGACRRSSVTISRVCWWRCMRVFGRRLQTGR